MSNTKILYCAYGRAGYLVLKLLIGELGSSLADLFCFTYNYEENRQLLEALQMLNIEYSTASLRGEEARRKIEGFAPDVIVSMHYRDFIPGLVLQMARLGGFNLHPSLLPKYRGCFSVPWVIINGESKTGITYHYMNEKFDDGHVVLQREVEITEKETAYSLFHKLIDLGVEYFAEAFDLVVNQRYPGHPQIGEPTYYPRGLPYGGWIDPTWTLLQVARFIRAMIFPPKPGARVNIGGEIYEVKSLDQYKELMNID